MTALLSQHHGRASMSSRAEVRGFESGVPSLCIRQPQTLRDVCHGGKTMLRPNIAQQSYRIKRHRSTTQESSLRQPASDAGDSNEVPIRDEEASVVLHQETSPPCCPSTQSSSTTRTAHAAPNACDVRPDTPIRPSMSVRSDGGEL